MFVHNAKNESWNWKLFHLLKMFCLVCLLFHHMVFLDWFLSSEDLHEMFILLFEIEMHHLQVYCLSPELSLMVHGGNSKLCKQAGHLVLRGREG
jgi:hypothetical protein